MIIQLMGNMSAVGCAGLSVYFMGVFPEWSVGLAFFSGLLTAIVSQYRMGIEPEPPEETDNA
tara:strand:+ start:1440 stop:1625 length:186 start_codon:yes stop_codon:yes gene_type:complete